MEGKKIGGIQLGSLIGEGGMGKVYRARQEILDRDVAVKVIRSEIASGEWKERFLIEARTVAGLKHPGIVQVHHIEEESDGTLYLVMELVEGVSLERALCDQPRWSLERTARLLWRVADALQHVHDQGIVHRDLKPANILLDRGEVPKLTDFGIALLPHSAVHTATGAVLGTPHYLAPEVIRGEKASPAADQYALAVIAHRMVGGSLPFVGDTPASILYSQLEKEPPSLRESQPDVPEAVEATIRRALSKEKSQRFASVIEFAQALLEAATVSAPAVAAVDRTVDLAGLARTRQELQATTVLGGAPSPTASSTRTTVAPITPTVTPLTSAVAPAPKSRRRRFSTWAAVAAAAVALAAGALSYYRAVSRTPPPVAGPVGRPIQIRCAEELMDWLHSVVTTPASGAPLPAWPVALKITGTPSAMKQVLAAGDRPDLILPGGHFWYEYLRHEWPQSSGEMPYTREASEGSASLADTLLVMVVWESSLADYRRRLGDPQAGFAQLLVAAVQKRWADLSVATVPRPWSNSAFSMWRLAPRVLPQPQAGRPEATWPALMAASARPAWLTEELAAVDTIRSFVEYGPASLDAIITYESLAIQYLPKARSRWEPYHVLYPPVSVWIDHPVLEHSGAGESPERSQAVREWMTYMQSMPVQLEARRRGLRPGNIDVPLRDDSSDNPFTQMTSAGVLIDIPKGLPPAQLDELLAYRQLVGESPAEGAGTK